MKTALLIFPHQLFALHPGLVHEPDLVCLVEDDLFFGDKQYPLNFHKQKLWLHRASMQRYVTKLTADGFDCRYLEYGKTGGVLQELFATLKREKFTNLIWCEPVDFVLSKRVVKAVDKHGFLLETLQTPGFLNTLDQNQQYRAGKKRWFMAGFYKSQRVRLDVLMNDGKPQGGQWSFDQENRKKIPKTMLSAIPFVKTITTDALDQEAREYVDNNFKNACGCLDELYYPTSHEAAEKWLDDFLQNRFELFGDYEDAIEQGECWLWHSVLTPALNIGLLTPPQVLEKTLRAAETKRIPLNSLEGFVRQVIGWREFMRATYDDLGVRMRTSNHWKHERVLPESFYTASTGILPVDDTIQRINQRGYCHHIERLMVLGGFMFLCEIKPDDVYRWFMEMFVDSYDWVMVPNVHAMSQNADGGLITTKPYFSGSAYVKKMSHYKHGEWADIWDGLYWRWIWNHRKALGKNPRWAMMCRAAERMDGDKMKRHLQIAAEYLDGLDAENG